MESASAVGKARRIGVTIVSGLVLLASCANERRSAAELADSLITVTDLEGEWTIDPGPDDDAAVSSSGVVTDEQRELLPRPDLCPDASTEARGVVDGLEWVMAVGAAATGDVVAIAGAILFMFSDSLIAESRFVRKRSWHPVGIMVTYHLALAGLVLSLL